MTDVTDGPSRAERLLSRHRAETGLEGDEEIILIHLLGDLMEWCDGRSAQGFVGPNFERSAAAAREMLRECETRP